MARYVPYLSPSTPNSCVHVGTCSPGCARGREGWRQETRTCFSRAQSWTRVHAQDSSDGWCQGDDACVPETEQGRSAVDGVCRCGWKVLGCRRPHQEDKRFGEEEVEERTAVMRRDVWLYIIAFICRTLRAFLNPSCFFVHSSFMESPREIYYREQYAPYS